MEITLSTKEFQTFINANNTLNRAVVSLNLYNKYIESILLSEDNSSVVLYSKINILDSKDMNLKDGECKMLVIKDMSKFQKLLDINNLDTFTFSIKKNYIYYKGTVIKSAKFMLGDNPPKRNKRISAEWFNMFSKTFSCVLDKQTIKSIIQSAAFTGLAETKAYFTTRDNEFLVELNDKTKDNIDNMTIVLSNNFTGSINNVIIASDILPKIYINDDRILIESSVISSGSIKAEALFFTVENENVLLKYMLNSKKS